MTNHTRTRISGRVADIFAHRFVVETAHGRILADLGPKGAEAFPLAPGLEIIVEGERKPSELKVARIALAGGAPVEIEHKRPGPHHDHPHVEPRDALKAVERAGFAAIGAPRRKPKHFEVLARKDGRLVECHVDLDGHIRKEKPIGPDDENWSREPGAAA